MNRAFEMVVPGKEATVGTGNLVHPFGLRDGGVGGSPHIRDGDEQQAPGQNKTNGNQNRL